MNKAVCYIQGMSNGLDVLLMKDPFGEFSEHDRCTDIEFGCNEWGSFFFNTLGVTLTEFIEGETFDEHETRRELRFRRTLEAYPLLSRIDEFYKDAHYAADEVPALQAELSRVDELGLDDDGRAFLDGMVKACDLALSAKMGILLSSS